MTTMIKSISNCGQAHHSSSSFKLIIQAHHSSSSFKLIIQAHHSIGQNMFISKLIQLTTLECNRVSTVRSIRWYRIGGCDLRSDRFGNGPKQRPSGGQLVANMSDISLFIRCLPLKAFLTNSLNAFLMTE